MELQDEQREHGRCQYSGTNFEHTIQDHIYLWQLAHIKPVSIIYDVWKRNKRKVHFLG